MEAGINFALDNIQHGETVGKGAGWAADWVEDRSIFLAGVRMVEALSFEQRLAIEHLLRGSANMADAVRVPKIVLDELRKRETNLDLILSLVESGQATPHLPPYED